MVFFRLCFLESIIRGFSADFFIGYYYKLNYDLDTLGEMAVAAIDIFSLFYFIRI